MSISGIYPEDELCRRTADQPDLERGYQHAESAIAVSLGLQSITTKIVYKGSVVHEQPASLASMSFDGTSDNPDISRLRRWEALVKKP